VVGAAFTKPGEKALGPRRRNTRAGTKIVSNYPNSPIRYAISPKLRRSIRVHVSSGRSTLNRQLILSRQRRSQSRLDLSLSFFLTRPSVCSRRTPLPVRGLFVAWRSAECWLTATSLASSASVTTGFDRGQFDASDRNQVKEHLLLVKTPPFSLSFDPLSPGVEVGPTGTTSLSRPTR